MKMINLQNELVEAQAAYEIAREALRVESQKLSESCVNIIKAYLIEDAIVVRPRVDIAWYEERGLEFRCEVGFQAEGKTEGYLDFASDFNFYFEEGKLKINHGTTGSFSLEDITLVKRIKVMSNILTNGRTIEEQFKSLPIDNFAELRKAKNAKEIEISKIKQEIQIAKREAIVEDLAVGNIYRYTDKAERWDNLIPYVLRHDHEGYTDQFEITKLTEKFVWLDVNRVSNQDTTADAASARQPWIKKIRKDVLVSFILSEKLECVERKVG